MTATQEETRMAKQKLPTPTVRSLAFGRRLRKFREARGWNLVELGEASGVTKAYIGRIEKGIVINPSWYSVLKLADALGVALDEFR